MPFKGCILDLDGTTLDSRDVISAENLNAIERLRERGLFIAVATGRSHLMIKEYIAQLGVQLPIIACNGGMIREVDYAKPPVFVQCIDKARAMELLNWRRKNGFDALVYTRELVYHPKGSKRALKYIKYNKTCDPRYRVDLREIDEENIECFAGDIVKLLFAECDNSRQAQLEALFNHDAKLYIVSSMSGLVDVMAGGVSKGLALKLWAQRLNVPLEELIVFGDNYNDISMFQIAGMSIAMGNAEEEVKKEADFVTLSNDQSGIAHAITNYVLERL